MNRRRNFTLLWIGTIVLVLAALVLLTWQNYRYAQQNKGGYDFMVQWMSTRTFLTQGISPYTDESALRTQTFAYGRAARSGEAQLRYVYPLYSMAVYFPFALIADFNMARAVFMTVLEAALLAMMIFSLRLTRWRPRAWEMLLLALFSLFWFHSIRPLLDGNSAILIGLFFAGGLLALKNRGDGPAGLLFALTTIKPNIVVLALAFLMIWSLVSGRRQVAGWMLGTLVLLSATAALLLPNWMWQNLIEVVRFPSYASPGTISAVLAETFPAMASRIARIMYGLLAGMLLAEWWSSRRADFPGLLWASLFTLVINQWIGIPTSPGNFIILLPALVLVFGVWEERWRRAGRVLAIASMLLLFGVTWGIALGIGGERANLLLFFPVPAFLIITLYWVRWWAIHPPNVWFDMIYKVENP